MRWIAEQWSEIRGNVKWDLLKLAGAAMTTAAYLVLQKIRHLSLDWWVAAGLFIVSLVVFIVASRRTPSRQQNTGVQTASSALPLSPAATFDWTAIFQRAYVGPFYEQMNKSIRIAADAYNHEDHEDFYAKLISLGLISYKYDIIWAYIYRSQFAFLDELNRRGFIPISEGRACYEAARVQNLSLYEAANFTFDQWLGFLKINGLALHHPSDMLEITGYGKDFLRYSTHNGWRATDRFN